MILFFNQNIEEAVRNLWKEFYTHRNPYTGLRYADDPTLVAFEFKNEDSAFWALNWVKRDRLLTLWNRAIENSLEAVPVLTLATIELMVRRLESLPHRQGALAQPIRADQADTAMPVGVS